ncbi:hypothetical protein [Mycolicibacterium tusciae]|nr:hypothetical protein [Mycolicibacterium tusciae]
MSQGPASNDVAALLFVSPRTVQGLTQVYTELGLSSHVQLAQ